MKYYYSKKILDGYEKISTDRNLNIVNEDLNKLVVINKDNVYHVLSFRNPLLEEDIKVLGYQNLVESIQESNLNVYFFNVDEQLSNSIINDINNNKVQPKIELPILKEDIYKVNDNEILKINAFVDREVIRRAIKEFFYREKAKSDFIKRMNKTESLFKKVSLKDFINDPDLLEMYKFPLFISNDEYVISTYNYINLDLFNILNDLYCKLGDKINLSEQNLKDLYLYSNSEYTNIVNEILNSIEINEEEKYDLDSIANYIDCIENGKSEDNNEMQLNKAKNILNEAKQNEEMFIRLGLTKSKEEKQLRKTVTR